MSATEGRFQTVPEPPPARRLVRSRSNRRIAGVCGGIAEYAGIDATVVRLLMVVLTFFGGAGPLLYVIACIAIPDERT